MKKAGIYLVSVAVESGTNRILKKMGKKTTVEETRKNIDRIKKHKRSEERRVGKECRYRRAE